VHATTSSIDPASATRAHGSAPWRVIDIVIAAILGVATGLIFWFWNTIGYLWFETADAVTPGLGGIATGIWLIGGVIGGLVIRKPGAALLVELIGAVVSMLVGNVWGVATIYSGIVQGLGAELVFAVFAYRRFGVVVASLAGIGAGVGAWIFEFFTGNIEKSATFNVIYFSSIVVSGALLAGVLGWVLVRALAATGALSRFAAGRHARRDV
jgi:energy-coupling factor transport system substrate-specific component